MTDANPFKTVENLAATNTKVGTLIKINKIFHSAIENSETIENFNPNGIIKVIQTDMETIKKNEFDWIKEVHNTTNRKVFVMMFNKMSGKEHSEMINAKIFRTVFTLPIIQKYMELPNYTFGNRVYDETLRFHTGLITGLIIFHLKYDFRFRDKIDSMKITMSDPFLRQKIRITNYHDKVLREKYFGEGFNIKKLIKILLENYFPNVSWRWIGSGHHAHTKTLELIVLTLELGLWEAGEMRDLLRDIYTKADTLTKLEKFCHADAGRLSDAFVKEIQQQLNLCRQYTSFILNQCLTLINDYAFISSIPFVDYNIGEFVVEEEKTAQDDNGKRKTKKKDKKIEILKHVFFKKSELYSLFSDVVINYLISERKINGVEQTTEEMSESIYSLMMYISDINKDPFICSLDLVDQSSFEYYIDCSSCKMQINQDCDKIRTEMFNVLTEISDGIYGEDEFMNDQTLQGKIINICRSLQSCLSRKDRELVYYKHKLSENDLPTMLQALCDYMQSDNEEVNDIVSVCLFILKDQCLSNFCAQAQIFKELGWFHFNKIYMNNPLKCILILQYIFDSDNLLVFLSMEVFNRLYGSYKLLMNKFFSESATDNFETVDNVNMCDLLSQFTFNRIFHTIMSFHKLPPERVVPIDQIIARCLLNPVIKHVIPVLKNEAYLPHKEDGEITFEPKLLNCDTSYILFLLNDNTLDNNAKKCLIFELFNSFLCLFNKCTRWYSGTFYKSIIEVINMDNISSFDYLYNFPCGIIFRTQIVQLLNRFVIFYSNHLLSDRLIHNKNPRLTNLEEVIPQSHLTGRVAELVIIREIKNVDKFLGSLNGLGSKAKYHIDKFIFKAFFPIIYKYVKGVLCLYAKDDKLDVIKGKIDSIFNIFNEKMAVMPNILGMKGMNNNIKGLIGVMANVEIGTHSKDNVDQHGVAIGEDDDMERDEVLYTDLLDLRKKASSILKVIDDFYDEHPQFKYLLDQYIRPTSLKISQSANQGQMSSYLLSSSFFQKKFGNLLNMEASNDVKDVNEKEYYSCFTLLKKRYKIMKKEYILDDVKKNRFVIDLKSSGNEEGVVRWMIHQLESMKVGLGQLEADLTADQELKQLNCNYWINPKYRSYIQFQDNLVGWNQDFRNTLFKETVGEKAREYKEPTDPDKGFDDMTCEPRESVGERYKIYGKLYYLFIELYYITAHKPFMDEQWCMMHSQFIQFANFFQNLCENNDQDFKCFFNKYKPKCEENPKFNSGNQTLVFNYYVHLECYANYTQLWTNKDKKLVLSDRKECFDIYNKMFEGLTEFITGPCIYNQFLIYCYRIDIWVSYISRVINDTDSPFYELKYNCLIYLMSFIEGLEDGKNRKIVEFMGNNIEPHTLYDLMMTFIKKLYIREKLKQNKDLFKKSKGSNAQSSPNLLRQNSSGNNQAMGIDDDKEKSGENEKCSVITDEQENLIRLETWHELEEYYRTHKSFSGHILVKITLKIWAFMQMLSRWDKAYQAFIEEKNMEISKHYRTNYELDDQQDENNNDLDELVLENDTTYIEENISIFYFIKKIVLSVEIRHESSVTNKKQQVNIYFQKLPMCFYLTSKTRNDFETHCEIDDIVTKRTSLMNHLDKFMLEMEGNQKMNEFHSVIHWISKDDNTIRVLWLIYILSCILNFQMIYFYERDITRTNFNPDDDWKYKTWILNGISIAIVAISAIYLLIFFLFKFNIEFKIRKKDFERRYPGQDPENLLNILYIGIYSSILKKKAVCNFFLHSQFSTLALTTIPFFSSLHLLLIFNLSLTSEKILDSVTKHYDQLLSTLVLSIFLIYFWSLQIAYYFKDEIMGGSECDKQISCFFYIFNQGLRMGGGVGDIMFQPVFKNVLNNQMEWQYIGRFFLNFLFFIFITLVMLNIVFGIIIDTFGEQRDAQYERGTFFAFKKTRYPMERLLFYL